MPFLKSSFTKSPCSNISDSSQFQETTKDTDYLFESEEYNEFLQIKSQCGSQAPDDTKLFCNNVKSYQCQNCFIEYEDMIEFVDHQIECDHVSEPKIIMKPDFLELVESSKVMNSAIGILNSSMLKDTTVVKDVVGEMDDSFLRHSSFNNSAYSSGFGNSSILSSNFNNSTFNNSNHNNSNFNNSSFNSTLNQTSLSQALISSLNTTHSKSFFCKEPGCDFVGFNCLQLSAHTRSTHYQSKCNECGKTYANSKCLKQHQQRVHDKVVKANCGLCGKGFYSKNALNTHKKNCKGKACDQLDDGNGEILEKYRLHCRMENCTVFYTSSSVTSVNARRLRHERAHGTEDWYECYYCGIKFEEFSSFTSHLRDGECEQCTEEQPLNVLEANLIGGIRECYV